MLDIIFNVVTYNRIQIATESIMKLIMQQPKNSIVDIIDYCSSEGNLYELEYLLNEPLTDYFCKNQLRQNKVNLGVELNNTNRLNDNIYNDEKQFVYLTDNDVMYSKKFYLEVEKLKKIMQSDTNIFAGTLFNFNLEESTHFETKEYNEDYVCKNSFGGISMLIRVKDFKAAMQVYKSGEYRGVQGWDWAICYFAKTQNKLLVSTKNSYVQHIGCTGVNSHPSRFDYANNFVK